MSIFDDAIFDDDEILEPDEDMDASEELVDWKTKIAEARRLAMSAMLYDEECEKRIHSVGTADACHNKSCAYAQLGDFPKAIEVCEEGLKLGVNPDLTGDLINYNAKLGRYDQVHHYLDMQMEKIPRKAWTWRSYTFAIEALISEDVQANEALLRELVKDYQAYLPMEERAFEAEFELEQALGNRDEALAVLEKAVKAHPGSEQCAIQLADILLQNGDFIRAHEMAIRAISASAQCQSGIQCASAAMILCFCKDALLWQDIAQGRKPDIKRILALRKQYEALMECFHVKLMPFQTQIEARISLITILMAGFGEA